MANRQWIDPATAVARYREANALYKKGRFDEALAILETVHAAYPRMQSVALALGMCRDAIALRDGAPASVHEEAIDTPPEDAASTYVEAERWTGDDWSSEAMDQPAPVDAIEVASPVEFAAPAVEVTALVPVGPAYEVERRRFTMDSRWVIAAGIVFGAVCGGLFTLGRTAILERERPAAPNATAAAPGLHLAAMNGTQELTGEEAAAVVQGWDGAIADDAPLILAGQHKNMRLWNWGDAGYLECAPESGGPRLVVVVMCPSGDVDALCAWDVVHSDSWRGFAREVNAVMLALPAAAIVDAPAQRVTGLVDAYREHYGIEDARFLLVGEGSGAEAAWQFVEARPERVLAAALVGWAPPETNALQDGWQAGLPIVMVGAENNGGEAAAESLREAAIRAGAPARTRYVNARDHDAEGRARTVTGELLAMLQGGTPEG